jgi:hypothetical protein
MSEPVLHHRGVQITGVDNIITYMENLRGCNIPSAPGGYAPQAPATRPSQIMPPQRVPVRVDPQSILGGYNPDEPCSRMGGASAKQRMGTIYQRGAAPSENISDQQIDQMFYNR